jgi:hypothetical protein
MSLFVLCYQRSSKWVLCPHNSASREKEKRKSWRLRRHYFFFLQIVGIESTSSLISIEFSENLVFKYLQINKSRLFRSGDWVQARKLEFPILEVSSIRDNFLAATDGPYTTVMWWSNLMLKPHVNTHLLIVYVCAQKSFVLCGSFAYYSNLKMEATHSSKRQLTLSRL